jgi:hypothetical protein
VLTNACNADHPPRLWKSHYKWHHLAVGVLFVALASFLVFYLERPDPMKKRLEATMTLRMVVRLRDMAAW